jgi:hypothetical protein
VYSNRPQTIEDLKQDNEVAISNISQETLKKVIRNMAKRVNICYAEMAVILNIYIDTVHKNTEALLDAGEDVGLEVNSEKTKYMLMSRKKEGQKHGIKIANRSFECVAKFKYLGTTLTDQNCMQEKIKIRLNSGNACYHSVQSFVFPPAVYKCKG